MKIRTKRLLTLFAGWSFIVLGILGLFLPVLQGILFLLIGLIILSTEYVWAHKLLQKIKVRFPKLAHLSEEAAAKAHHWMNRIAGKRKETSTECSSQEPPRLIRPPLQKIMNVKHWFAVAWGTLTGTEKEVWLRFFFAILGLVLSFAAAVFSTVERMSGNMVATAALATLSLLLAGVVGVTTVPYLARRVVSRRIRDVLDYEMTREGMVYFAFVLAIGIAALNTGNNLLFIIVSVMLGSVLVSGVASAAVLRALDLDVVLPAHVFAGTTATARIKLRNLRRFVPSFSVTVGPVKIKRKKRDKSLLEPPILAHSIFFPFIPAKTVLFADADLRFERRGRYSQRSFGLTTRFPFSFFVKTRRVDSARELIAYPSVQPTDEMLDTLPAVTGEFEAFVRGRGYDLYRIRDYEPHDPVHHVDWKATAKTGELKVREFTREDERRLKIVFDNPAPGIVSPERYEEAVRTAASLAWHFAAEDTELTFLAPDYAGQDVFDFLRYLALVQPREHEDIIERLGGAGEYKVIVTARPRGTLPTAVWAESYVIFMGS